MKRALLAAAVLALTPNVLLAQMSYSAFEVSWVDVELDGGFSNVDGDGFEIGGSYELNDDFFLFGEWQDRNLDFGIDGRMWEIGGGWHSAMSDTLDFVATLSFLDAEVDLGNFSADDDGLGLGAGLRARINDSFEIDAGI
jgi:hypothetical protein